MLGLIFCLIFWLLFAYVEGIREGYRKHIERSSKFQKILDLKIVLITQRLIMLIIFGLYLASNYSKLSILYILGLVLIFPFINNEIYFMMRNKLNPNIVPEKNGCECDKYEKPAIYIDYSTRSKMLILGISILIFTWILKIFVG